MLRKWHTAVATGYLSTDITEDSEEVLTWKVDKEGQPTLGSHLTKVQRADLMVLIDRYKGTLCSIPGQTRLVEHHIDTPGARPIRLPAYRLPQAYRELVKRKLKEMAAYGIIEPSESEWASPLVIVPKKDGSLRLCVDYCRLNSMSKTDAYPMPRVDELLDQLGKAKYISTLDLTKGYWQVPVAKEAQPKTAFKTPFGLYQFRRMSFGLQGAPATFQRLMD